MSPAILEFDRVQRWFGPHRVLQGLSFRVQPGQVYALLGRNGTGKTTALRILLGFLAPHAGVARVFGRDSTQLLPEHRARIGYVGEDHRLYPTMTVDGAVAFEAGTRPSFRRAFVERALQRCGLRGPHRIPRLSRGQRAQLSLVLAVASNPQLLVCDDPALGLDAVMRREFLDALIDLLADTGVSVLLSSHFLGDVERIADRIGILHEGTLLVDALLDDIKHRVLRCEWSPRNGAVPPSGPEVLRAAARRRGHQLTLLDASPGLLADLRSTGDLSEPAAPTLEDLFLDLTGPERPGLLSEPFDALLGEGPR
ncbi:MAG TPA: ABC transporter ATP-binding protein [Planctomycetota bacterium]|nr:ABC transporter ATP-binding protein [Planctomycetota bacterium]